MTLSEFQDYSNGGTAADQPDGGAGPTRPHSAGGDAAGDGTMSSKPQPAETSQEEVPQEEREPEAAPETGSYSMQAVEIPGVTPRATRRATACG